MKTQKIFHITVFALAVYLAFFLAAKPADLLSKLVYQQPKNVLAAGPDAIDNAVAILIPDAESNAMTHTVTALYNDPDSSSDVVQWLMPGQSVRLLGRSMDGLFFAVAGGEASEKVAGWIADKDISVEEISTHMVGMTKVYRQPDANDEFVNMLTYGQAINVLGTSRDGAFSAVARKDGDQKLIGWVLTSELQTEPK